MSAVIQSKTEKDSRVEAAISHWAPRFVANGVALADFQESRRPSRAGKTGRGLVRARRGPRGDGQQGARRGYNYSARSALHRAAVCYHFGKFSFRERHGADEEAHRRADRMPQQGAAASRSAGERVADSYEGRQLYGN